MRINKAIFFSLIFALLLSQNMTVGINQDYTEKKINYKIVNGPQIAKEQNQDYHIVKVDQSQDLDHDKIQDQFERKLTMLDKTEMVDAILTLNSKSYDETRKTLEKLGIHVLEEYDVIYGMHIRGSVESLQRVRALGNLNFLEENAQSHALLMDAMNQIEARKVWASNGNYGYTGNPNTAIAILDTGIDDNHAYVNFDIVYWQDFIGADAGTTGDEYATPTDKGEHGTHCASIALGNSDWSNGTVVMQDSGRFPLQVGSAYYGSWFYYTNGDVKIDYAWESGTPFIGIIDDQGNWVWHNYNNPDTTSPASHTITLTQPGWYAVMWGNKAGAGNSFYSGQTTYQRDWNYSYEPVHGAFTGVAPDSKLVGLKVLDDTGSGTADALLNALDWVYNNGQNYNVTVVSMSLGFASVVSSVDSAVSSLVREKGIVCVVSAGNSGTSSGGIFSPASSPDCIAVAAVNKADEIAYYSSVGDPNAPYIRPDVAAPGGSMAFDNSSAPHQPIFAADSSDADSTHVEGEQPGIDYYPNNFRGMQGTSMAAPMVAGLAQIVIDAIIQEEGTWQYSWENAKRVKQIICMSTFEVRNLEGNSGTGGEAYDGDQDGIPQDAPINRITKDNTEGWGRVSVEAAVQAVTRWLNIGEVQTINLDGKHWTYDANNKPINGHHVEVRRINLQVGVSYQIIGQINNGADIDILLFDNQPSDYGDPVLVTGCTRSSGTLEAKTFQVNETAAYYLVIRWVGGNYTGSVDLKVVPFISLVSPSEGSIISPNTEVTVEVEQSWLDTVLYNWDNNANNTWSSPYITNAPTTEGNHTLYVYARDQDGVWTTEVYSFTVVDNSTIVIELLRPNNNSYQKSGTNIEVNITADNLDTVLYNWDNNANSTWSSPYTTALPSGDGGHHLYVYVNTTTGKADSAHYYFMTDDTPPQYENLTQTSSQPEYDEDNTVAVDVYEAQGASGVDTILLYYRINGGAWIVIDVTATSTYTFTADMLQYADVFDWYFWFNDSVGNSAQTILNSFTVADNSAPTYSNFSQSNSAPEYDESNTVSITVDEPSDASGVNTILFYYRIDGGNWIVIDVSLTSSYTFAADLLQYGQFYEFYFWFNDTAGNSAQTGISSFTVVDNTAPTYSNLSQSNSAPEYDESNTASVSIYEPSDASGVNTILFYYRINGGNWIVIDVSSTSSYTFAADLLQYGEFYEFYFWFNDTAGNSAQTGISSFTVMDNTAPTYSNLTQTNPAPEYDEENTISVSVYEPSDASGVDTILFYYRIDGGNWIVIDVSSTSSYTFAADLLQYGQFYEFYFWFNDTAGNSAQTGISSFTVMDNTAPTYSTPTQSNSSPEYDESNTISITVNEPSDASGVDSILLYYRINGGSWNAVDVTIDSTFTFTSAMLEYGQNYDWYFWFNDTAGNSDQTSVYSFTVEDYTSPAVSSVSQSSSTPEYDENNVISVTLIEPSDASGVNTILLYYRVDSGGWTAVDITLTGSFTFTADMLKYSQFYEWYVWFNDSASNANQTSVYSFTVEDHTSPILTITSPSNQSYFNFYTISLAWDSSDDGSGINYFDIYMNGSLYLNTVDYSASVTFISDGTFYISIIAFDYANNSISQTLLIYIDTVSPQLEITSPYNGQTIGVTWLIEWTSYDDFSGIAYFDVLINGTLVSSTTIESYSHSFTSAGFYNITIVAYDLARNSISASVIAIVDHEPPEITIVSPTNNSEFFYLGNITLEWLGSDNVAIDHYKIFINGSLYAEVTNSSVILNLSFSGTYNITVQLYDIGGNSAYDQVSVYVYDDSFAVELVDDFNNWLNDPSIDLRFSLSNNRTTVYMQIYVNGKSIYDDLYVESFALTIFQEGLNNVTVLFYTDYYYTQSIQATILLDLSPPAITNISITNNSVFYDIEALSIAWSITDNVSGINNFTVLLNGTSVDATVEGVVLHNLVEGVYYLEISAYDLAGNYINITLRFEVVHREPNTSTTTENTSATSPIGNIPMIVIVAVIGLTVLSGILIVVIRRLRR